MWDGHFGRITVAKQRIELSQPYKATVQAVPCRAGPNSRESEKAEIDETLAENVIKPSQTECAVPIVFVPKKDGTI